MCYLSSITTGAKIVQISVICKSLTLFDFCLGHEFPKRWCAFDGELGESAFTVFFDSCGELYCPFTAYDSEDAVSIFFGQPHAVVCVLSEFMNFAVNVLDVQP